MQTRSQKRTAINLLKKKAHDLAKAKMDFTFQMNIFRKYFLFRNKQRKIIE